VGILASSLVRLVVRPCLLLATLVSLQISLGAQAQTPANPPPVTYPNRGSSRVCLMYAPGPGSPDPPSDLHGVVQPYGPIGLVGPGLTQVQLSWAPVSSADCVGIEVRSASSTSWAIAALAPGGATTADIQPQQLPSYGDTYCFRAFTANQLAASPYSEETCVSVASTSVTYAPGWNLVAGGTQVTDATDGPIYTYDSAADAYGAAQAYPPPPAGVGYWAYFDSETLVAFPKIPFQRSVSAVPAGHYALVGNSSGVATASLSGADVMFVYHPETATYQEVTTLDPGQGAWVYSAQGGAVTITPVDAASSAGS